MGQNDVDLNEMSQEYCMLGILCIKEVSDTYWNYLVQLLCHYFTIRLYIWDPVLTPNCVWLGWLPCVPPTYSHHLAVSTTLVCALAFIQFWNPILDCSDQGLLRLVTLHGSVLSCWIRFTLGTLLVYGKKTQTMSFITWPRFSNINYWIITKGFVTLFQGYHGSWKPGS